MTLTVFKNFTRMSKNGVCLKNMGHRKDVVFALYSFVSPLLLIEEWWARADSNCRPHDYQSCALTN